MAGCEEPLTIPIGKRLFTILIILFNAACCADSASTSSHSLSSNPVYAGADPLALTNLIAVKAKAVDTKRHALVLLRELRSLNDSIANANAKLQEIIKAREKLNLTSARLAGQRKVIDELSAIIDETARRLYKQDGSDEARLALVTAGEAKLEAERLAARIARMAMRLRDKVASYGIAEGFRDEFVKASKQRLPAYLEAERSADEAVRGYYKAWRHAMEFCSGNESTCCSEADVMRIFQEQSSRSVEQTATEDTQLPGETVGSSTLETEQGGVMPASTPLDQRPHHANVNAPRQNSKMEPYLEEIGQSPSGRADNKPDSKADKQKEQNLSRKRMQAVGELSEAEAEAAVARALLDTLQSELQAWKSSMALVRTADAKQKLKTKRQELDNAEGDAEYAVFQVKEAEKDLQQAKDQAAGTAEMLEEQKKIVREANKALAAAAAAESERHTLAARMQREEAEEVKAQAERVAAAMERKVRRAGLLVLERRETWHDAIVEREKAAKKAEELKADVIQMEERFGEPAAKEVVRLMNLLKPIVIAKHVGAGEAKQAWGRYLRVPTS